MSTVESIIPYLSKWYAIILGAVLVYSFTRYLKVRSFMKKHGCEETFALRGGLAIFNFFNLPYLRQMLDAKRNGEVMELFKSVFDDDDVLTCYLRLGGVRVVCTIDPENVKAVLATQFSDFALGTRHAHFKPLLGDGIFTLDGEGWKHSRAMLRPQFARDQVSHVTSLEPHLQTFAKHVRSSKGNTLDLQSLFFKLTVDTATEFLFGESVHSLYDESIGSPALTFDGKQGFADAFNLSQAWLASRSYSQVFYRLVDSRGFRKSCSDVHKFAAYYVDKALNASPEEIEEKSKGGYTFLYELVKQTRNRNVLQDQLLNILVAGRDTTAGLLSFTFFELARNPETWAKLKQEIETHFGTGTPEDISNITFETLKKCEYLKLVLNEVLRLYPSVPVNFRVATKDTTIPRGGGKDAQSPVFVGKGTTVAYCVFATQRLESYYGKDANEFRPERWNELSSLGWAYLPFNGGPRICLGQQFALTEASYIVVRLAQMFPNLISKDDRPYPPKKSVHLTMCHQDGVYVEMS